MMKQKSKLTTNERRLMRRYLIWCYKTTKEEMDKIDRYFTQLKVDRFVLQKLKTSPSLKKSDNNQSYAKLVNEFKVYMEKKESAVLKKKFRDVPRKILNADYDYLRKRFAAIEQAIGHFLGNKALKEIVGLYEQEMTTRILQAREHA